MNFIPIFKSNQGQISVVKYVHGNGSLFVATDQGKINKITGLPLSTFGTGLTEVYSQILNGDGDLSSLTYDYVYYDLYRSVVSVFADEFEIVKENINSYGINKSDKVTGVYISDVLVADEDFGFWKNITWTQSVSGARVVIALKVAESESELLRMDWQYYIEEPLQYGSVGGSSVFSKSLDRFNLKGRFLQFKVIFETTSAFSVPFVSELIVSYGSKSSVLFFTRKFKITRGDNIDNIILTATYSEPQKTELRFGIINSNSTNWPDYRIVDLNELVSLPSNWGNMIKVGIKFSSYSESQYATVQEFAFLIGSKTETNLNED